MNVELLRQLDQRLLALDRGYRNSIVGKTNRRAFDPPDQMLVMLIPGLFSDPPHTLKAGLWFRRGRLAMVFSSLAAACCSIAGKLIHWINFWPGSYAENPLIPAVQISAATSVELLPGNRTVTEATI
ncbi:hypothetical protein EG244_16320 [Falsigemmobacter faecalis]|uniref:Uncharacterized protein n=2 Tax=Falsigemmobacter faecalis TaxID=2488730 RepID=A0A3P3DG41_9RHOB|nr:hypothetical protein EG244_16320 [Falsigemmobacter faecalis]